MRVPSGVTWTAFDPSALGRRAASSRLFMLLVVSILGVGIGYAAARYLPPWWSQPRLTIPAQVHGEPGRLIRVEADASGSVRWHAHTPGLDLLPQGNRAVVVTAPAKGRYELMAWTARGNQPSDPATTVVVIGDVPPVPPGPGPKPPVPPDPPPVPPDPFFAAVREAWAKETAADRDYQKDKLKAFYSTAQHVAREPGLKTLSDLHAVLDQSGKQAFPEGTLAHVRGAVKAELQRLLPKEPNLPLDAALRDQCAAAFARVQKALEGT